MPATRPAYDDASGAQVLALSRENESRAVATEAFLHLIADHAADLITIQRANGRYLFVSENSLRLFGWRTDQLLDHSMRELVHPDYWGRLDACAALHACGRPTRAIYKMLHACGRYRWVENRSRATADGRYVVSVVRDVHSRAKLLLRLRREAYSDALTGLHNRRSLAALLATELQRSHRKRCTLAVAFIDCDRFKDVNDSFGHRAGDEMLRNVGRCIVQAKRTYDIAGRWGGDEFLLLLPETNAGEAASATERVRELLRAAMPEVTLSVGISSTACASTKEQLLLQADAALYEAKRLGGDRVMTWQQGLSQEP